MLFRSKKLTDEGFLLVGASEYTEGEGFTYPYPSDRIMVDRFFYLYNFLKMMDKNENVNRVIVTDVRDVIFQDNPTTWLDDSLLTGYDMLVGSENLRYKDEPWGRNNLKASFGEYFYEDFKDEEIYCAGVIAGLPDALRDACLNLWLICRGSKPQIEGGGGPDQAAMNIMLDMVSYTFSTKFTNPTEGWVVHAGTSMPAIEAGSGGIGQTYKQNPNMLLPFIHDVVYTVSNNEIHANGKKLTIVHQWDRVPAWKELIEEKYGE